MEDFSRYGDSVLSAFKFNPKTQEIVDKKKEILDALYLHYNITPTDFLFVGFSPLIFATKTKHIAVAEMSDDALQFLTDCGIKFTKVDLATHKKKFQCVVAMDEYFTFAADEEEQKQRINTLCKLTSEFAITTMRDYKNMDVKEKDFSYPVRLWRDNASKIFLEAHQLNFKDRNNWETSIYEIDGNNLTTYGPFARRSVMFRQMARMCLDSGAADFLVHKNLMYKNLIKKNYEHVISIRFE